MGSAMTRAGVPIATGARGKGWRTKRARRRALSRSSAHSLRTGWRAPRVDSV